MKTCFATLALLCGTVCADEVRPINADTAVIKFDEPVVPLSVCHNAAAKAATDTDKGLGLFEVTGDDRHRPELRWVSQNMLRIKFAPGTSCSTVYCLEFKPEAAKYLSGQAMPEPAFTFSMPSVALESEMVPGLEDGVYLVFPERACSQESKAFSVNSGATFVYRQVLSGAAADDEDDDGEEDGGEEDAATYGDSIPAVVEPALFKHIRFCTPELVEQWDAGRIDWAALTPDTPVPGAVLVRPQSPLPAGTTWRLFHSPAPGIKAGGEDPFIVEQDFMAWMDVHLPSVGGKLELRVEFAAPVTCGEAMRVLRVLREMGISAGGVKAVTDADGRCKTLSVDGKECRIAFAGFKDAGWQAKTAEDRVVRYTPEGLTTGLVLTVEGEVPPVLDVDLPAGITAALGRSSLTPRHCRLSLTPVWPSVGKPADGYAAGFDGAWLLPLSGDHKLRLPVVDVESLDVEVYPLTGEAVVEGGRELRELVRRVDSGAERYVRARNRFRRDAALGCSIPDSDAQRDALLVPDWKAKQTKRAAAAAAHLQAVAGSGPAPAVKQTVDIPDMREFIRKGEAVVDLDALAGGNAAPGYYLLHFTWHAVPAVRRALADLDLPEDMLDEDRYLLVSLSDLHIQTSSDAMMITRLSDGQAVAQAQVTRYSAPEDVDDDDDLEADDEDDGEAEDGESPAATPVKPVRTESKELRDGFLSLASFAAPERPDVGFYLVQAGDDVAVVRPDEILEEDDKHRVFILTDRDFYRPGDTVHVRGVLRHVEGCKSASIPQVDGVRLTVRRPDGSDMFSRTVKLDASGGIDESFTLPDGGEDVTGCYEVEVASKDGEYGDSVDVEVAVFRRSAFKVDFKLEIAPIHPTQFSVHVQADDYNGTPVSHGKARLEILSAVPILTLNGSPAAPVEKADDAGEDDADPDEEDDWDDIDEEWIGREDPHCSGVPCLQLYRYTCEAELDGQGHAVVEAVLVDYASLGNNNGSVMKFEVWGGVSNDRSEFVGISRDDSVEAYAEATEFVLQLKNGMICLEPSPGADDGAGLPHDQTIRVELVCTEAVEEKLPNGITLAQVRVATLHQEDILVPAHSKDGVEWSPQRFMELMEGKGGGARLVFSATDSKGYTVRQEYSLEYVLGCCSQPSPAAVRGKAGFAVQWMQKGATLGADGALHVPCMSSVSGNALFILADEFRAERHYVRTVQPGWQEIVLPVDGLEGEVQVVSLLPLPGADGRYTLMERGIGVVHLPVTSGVLQTSLEVPAAPVRPKESVCLSGRVVKDGAGVPATVTLFAVDEGMLLGGGAAFSIQDFIGGASAIDGCFLNSVLQVWRRRSAPEVDMMPRVWVDALPLSYAQRFFDGFEGDSSDEGDDSYDDEEDDDDDEGDGGFGREDDDDDDSEPSIRFLSPLRRDFRPLAVWRGTLKTDADGRFSTQAVLPDTCTTYKVYALALGDDGATFGCAESGFTVSQPLMLTPGTPFFMSVGDTLRLPLTVTNNTDAEGTWTVELSFAKAPQKVTVPAHGSATLYFEFTAKEEGEAVLRWMASGEAGGDAVQGSFPVRFPAPVLKEAHHIMLESGREQKLASLLSPELAGATGCEVEVLMSANPLLHLAGCMDYLLEYPYGCTEQLSSGLLPWLFHERLAPLSPALAKTSGKEVRKVIADTVEKLFRRQRVDGGLGYWPDSEESCYWASAHAALVLTIAKEQGYGALIPAEKMEALRGYLHTEYPCAKKNGLSPLTLYALGRVLGSKPCLEAAFHQAGSAKYKGAWWWNSDIQTDFAFIKSMRQSLTKRHAAFLQWMRSRGRDYRHTSTVNSAWTFIALHEYLRSSPAPAKEALVTLSDGTDLVLNQGVTVLKPQAARLADLSTVLTAEQGTVYVTLKVKGRPTTTAFSGVEGKGLQISRIYEKQDADGVWREASEFAVGDVVRVTLTCAKSAPELSYIVLEDYLPACMEAVNPDLPGQSAGLEDAPWSQWFDHKEYLGDRVRGFCSEWKDRGTLNMVYYARVMRAGTSTAPPAQAQLMYEPQTYALSPNSVIRSK